MAKTETIGSWFPSGYHGHFRSKSRTDFLCEYRHLAKPQPPKKFIRRIKEPTATYSFSKHDNRHSFMNDAVYFEEGHGRRRITNSTNRYDTNLLAWMPQKPEIDRSGPSHSVYKITYRGVPTEALREQITKRPKTSFDDNRPVTTSYRYSHGRDNPNKDSLNVASNLGLTARAAQKPKGSGIHATSQETVATCLSWYEPPRMRPQVPAATQTTVYPVPSPPAQPPVHKTAPAAIETTPATPPVAMATTPPAIPAPPPRPFTAHPCTAPSIQMTAPEAM